MPIAEIISIGTELLLGEIQDTNTRFIARTLRDYGVDIYRTTIIGDNPERVAQVVRDASSRAQIIITTGGLGPTVDDPTREAIALATDSDLEFHPELWDQIVERVTRFGRQPTTNNRRQAFLPRGATAIENAVGTAPAFYVEFRDCTIICLPGVPREMEYLMSNAVIPYLHLKYPLHGIIKARVLHTVGMGESQVDEIIGDLERSENPTVGLLAHAGQVDVRIAAKAKSEEQANKLIMKMENVLRKRLGDSIFGSDEETLEAIIKQYLDEKQISISLLECGMNGNIAHRLNRINTPIIEAVQHSDPCDINDLKQEILTLIQRNQTNYGLGVSLNSCKSLTKTDLLIIVIMDELIKEGNFSFGGHPSMAINWATTISMNFFRKCLFKLS